MRTGKLFAGQSGAPYKNQATITVHGAKGDRNFILLNEFIDSSSKVFAVTGGVQMVGITPGTVWTRLAAFADAGTDFIEVLEAKDWKVGDEIVVAPSGRIPS